MKLNIFEEKYFSKIETAMRNIAQRTREELNNLGNGSDFGLAIGLTKSILAEELRGKINSDYDSEKLLYRVSYKFMIDNLFLPKEEANQFKTSIVTVLSGCTKQSKENDKYKSILIPTHNQTSYGLKGHSLAIVNSSQSMLNFQENKSSKVLEIKTLNDTVWAKYRALLQTENKKSLNNESIVGYSKRLDKEVEELMSLQGMKFNNYNRFASHGRNYSRLRLLTSDKFLQSLVQSSEYHTLKEDNIDTLKYWLSFTLLGKRTRSQAIKAYDGRKIYPLIKKMTKDVTSIKKLAKLVRVKEAYFLVKSGVGTETKFLPDFDGISLGSTTLANQLRQDKLMVLSNLIKPRELHDNHSNLLESARKICKIDKQLSEEFSYITRNDIKPVNTVFIHGGSIETCAKNLGVSLDMTHQIMAEHVGEDAYLVPSTIAEFGKSIHEKGYSVIEFPRPLNNGKVQSVGYTQKTQINLSEGEYQYTVYADMPILKGLPTNHVSNGGKEKDLPKKVKVNGLLAVIIHALDNAYLEELYKRDLITDDKFDCYFGWNDEAVVNCVAETMELTKDYLKNTLSYLSDKYGVEEPKIKYGSSKITATNFIAP